MVNAVDSELEAPIEKLPEDSLVDRIPATTTLNDERKPRACSRSALIERRRPSALSRHVNKAARYGSGQNQSKFLLSARERRQRVKAKQLVEALLRAARRKNLEVPAGGIQPRAERRMNFFTR